jgi:hypothetical protein
MQTQPTQIVGDPTRGDLAGLFPQQCSSLRMMLSTSSGCRRVISQARIVFLLNDVFAQLDAFIADEHRRSGAHLMLALLPQNEQ